MIADLHKPVNQGEGPVLCIRMSRDEARKLLDAWDRIDGHWLTRVNHEVGEFFKLLRRAVLRNIAQ